MHSFTALADPTRQRIVEMLATQGQLSVADIGAQFEVSAPAISQHLKVLREARLVAVEARAQQRLYSLDPVGVEEIEQWVAALRTHWAARFDALDTLLALEMKKQKPTNAKKARRHD
jgi:DNA-binding transcriptional ArsR family regulator